MKIDFYKVLVLVAFLTVLNSTTAQSNQYPKFTGKNCPGNTEQILMDVCIGEGLSHDTVLPLSSSNTCPATYSNLKGTNFCLKRDDLSLSRLDGFYIIKAANKKCFEGFTRIQPSGICIDKRLGLIIEEKKLKLINAPTNLSFSSNQCAPGFYQPSDAQQCISLELLLTPYHKLKKLGIHSSGKVCDEDFFRPNEGEFCRPKKSLIKCGTPDSSCKDLPDNTLLLTEEKCCSAENAKLLIFLPKYEVNSSEAMKYKAALVCDHDAAPPARGQPLSCFADHTPTPTPLPDPDM